MSSVMSAFNTLELTQSPRAEGRIGFVESMCVKSPITLTSLDSE